MTTEAGKRLLERINERSEWAMSERSEWLVLEDIAAIEAEAVAAERARIAEAVRGLENVGDDPWGYDVDHVDRAAVLALLKEPHLVAGIWWQDGKPHVSSVSPPSVTDRLDNGTNWNGPTREEWVSRFRKPAP